MLGATRQSERSSPDSKDEEVTIAVLWPSQGGAAFGRIYRYALAPLGRTACTAPGALGAPVAPVVPTPLTGPPFFPGLVPEAYMSSPTHSPYIFVQA